MKGSFRFIVVCLFVLGILPGRLRAQINLKCNQNKYNITTFSTAEGLAGNTLLSVQQDAQKYLWAGGFEGLTRFDGTYFLTVDPTTNHEFKSSQVSTLLSDKRGYLWIGSGQGLVKKENGKFANLSTDKNSFFIESMAIDEDQQSLLLGSRNMGLYKYSIEKNTYQKIETGFSKDIVTSITTDDAGNIWIASDKNGVANFDGRVWKYFTKADGLASNEVTWISLIEGKLYVCTILGLNVWDGDRFKIIEQLSNIRCTKIKSDGRSNLWVLTTSGIYIADAKGNWQVVTKDDGLPSNDIRDIYFDDEGSIWLATYRKGMVQLREEQFTTYTEREGLKTDATSAICQLTETKFLIGTTDGKLFTIENGTAAPFPIQNKINKPISKIIKDHNGNLWLATYDGLLLITPGGKEKLFTEIDGLPSRQLRSIIEDRNKNFWMGTRTSGVVKMEAGNGDAKPVFKTVFKEELNRLSANFIISMSLDSSDNLLLATSVGTIVKLSKDGTVKEYPIGARTGEPAFSARADKKGRIWAASSNGLSLITDDRVINFGRQEGLRQTIYDVVEDQQGYFWLPSSKGIVRVKVNELDNHIVSKAKIQWRLYDRDDGLTKFESTGACQIFQDNKGAIWFPMLEGLVTVKPDHVVKDTAAPQAVIESVTTDGQSIDLDGQISLDPGTNRLAFSYSAVSLKYRNSINYKYKIENFDNDWIEGGRARQAVYTSLPPGKYSFKVMACNKDQLCGKSSSITFTIQPHYYQTKWFYVIAVTLTIAFIILLFQIRTQSIRSKAAMLRRLVAERTGEIASQRDELIALNEELRSNQEEILAQRDALTEKNLEIEKINSTLESLVADRTHTLEEQNKKLDDYAFINAHQLRAPLASILGIIHLLEIEKDEESRKKLLELLQNSSRELDTVIRSINRMLEERQ